MQESQQPTNQTNNKRPCEAHPFIMEIIGRMEDKVEVLPEIRADIKTMSGSISKIESILYDRDRGSVPDRLMRLETSCHSTITELSELDRRIDKVDEKLDEVEKIATDQKKITDNLGKAFWTILISLVISALVGIFTFGVNIYQHLISGK